jgi:putative addiction module antidote
MLYALTTNAAFQPLEVVPITAIVTWRRELPMHQAKVIQIGDSLAIALPSEVVERLGIKDGQVVTLSETQNGFELTASDPAFERQMRAAEKIMDRYRDTLAKLAK